MPTPDSLHFVTTTTFSALASEPARTSLWDSPEPSPHTTLGQRADLVVVAPATARKPLSIAFEEIASDKIVMVDPSEAADAAASAAAEASAAE